MAARAMWKGSIMIGRTELPVKLFAAVEDQGVHFRLLHKTDKQPLKQQMVNPETGDIIEYAEVRRGFVDDGGILVKLDEAELEALEPEAGREWLESLPEGDWHRERGFVELSQSSLWRHNDPAASLRAIEAITDPLARQNARTYRYDWELLTEKPVITRE